MQRHLQGSCTNPFCEKWHAPECPFYKTKEGLCTPPRDEQPNNKGAVAILRDTRQRGCVSLDMEPPKSSSIFRKRSTILKPIPCVQLTAAVLRHADIWDEEPSRGMICPGSPNQRNPNAPKSEDWSQEETEL